VAIGQPIGNLPTPNRAGYSFSGWWNSPTGGTQINHNTVLNRNITLFARWHAVVSFNPNGGNAVNPSTRTVLVGTAIGNLPNTSRSGYTFGVWFIQPSLLTQMLASTIITGNLNLSARWRFTITFNGNGGQTPNPLILASGITVGELPRPTKDNHRFLGWATSQSNTNVLPDGLLIEGNATLWARWEVRSRVIQIPSTITGTITRANGTITNVILNSRANWFAFYADGTAIDSATGRIRIAVGPRILNSNYPDTGQIRADDFNLPINIDVVLRNMINRTERIIQCIVTQGGAKAHTFNHYPHTEHPRNGLFINEMVQFYGIQSGMHQTGIAYPRSWNSFNESQWAERHMDGSTIEFRASRAQTQNAISINFSDFELLQVIVYN